MSDSNDQPGEDPDDDDEPVSLLEQLKMTKISLEIIVMVERLLR